MSNSSAVQEARKKMQLARLEKKGDDDYTEFYVNQPLQKERARKNAEWRKARRDLANAAEALEVAEITGEGLQAAKEQHAIAALVVERLNPGARGAGMGSTLSGA